MKKNGGVIGPINTSSTSGASGMWSLQNFFGRYVAGEWPRQLYFGNSSDGALSTTGDVTYTVGTTDTDIIVKNYTNLTINSGHTITTSTRCRGLILYCNGNLSISGTISMNEKGAKLTSGDKIYVRTDGSYYMASSIADAADTLVYSDSNGGDGGDMISTSYADGYGGSGTTYSNPYAGGFGGGGAGGSPEESSSYYPGDGGDGPALGVAFDTSASRVSVTAGPYSTVQVDGIDGAGGASGSGSAYARYNTTYGATARAYSGYQGLSNGAGGGGSGAAGFYDAYYSFGTSVSAENGNAGAGSGGFVIIIVKGTVTINAAGIISANGGAGGAGGRSMNRTRTSSGSYTYNSSKNGPGGGGAGGGTVMINHLGTYTNNGSITVAGGAGGTSPTGGNPYGSASVSGSAGTVGRIAITDMDA